MNQFFIDKVRNWYLLSYETDFPKKGVPRRAAPAWAHPFFGRLSVWLSCYRNCFQQYISFMVLWELEGEFNLYKGGGNVTAEKSRRCSFIIPH